MKWFTSDLHFGHENIIKYCNRGYSSITEMNETLIRIWNSSVSPTDEVYVLGDFSLNAKYSTLILPLLNGQNKYLIAGNHDKCYPFDHGRHNKKADKFKQQYIDDGWSSVQLSMTINLGGYHIEMNHLPFAPKDNSLNTDTRYMNMRPENKGQWLIHGHAHKRWQKLGRMIDVGIDGDLKLYSEDDIIKLIEDPREFIPSPLTEWYKSRDQNGVS